MFCHFFLLKVSSHHAFPFILGFEEEFCNFAYGARAAGFAGNVMCGAFDFRDSICDGKGDANSAQYRKIGQIVADIGDLCGFEVIFFEEFFEDGELAERAQMNVGDAELSCAAPDRDRRSAGNDGNANASALKEDYSRAVFHIEAGEEFVLAQDDASIGHNAVNVEYKKADAEEFLFEAL
jgi:hypothetical protein